MATDDVTVEEAGDQLEMIVLSVNGRLGEAEQHDRASRHGGATQSSARAPASGQGGGRRAAQAGRRSMRILAEKANAWRGRRIRERARERKIKGKEEEKNETATLWHAPTRRRGGRGPSGGFHGAGLLFRYREMRD